MVERHRGTYANFRRQNDDQLLRAIKSHRKNIAAHEQRILNPAVHISAWKGDKEAYMKGIVKKWQRDIELINEQLDVAINVAKERGLDYEQ
jgi:hypothetical protein